MVAISCVFWALLKTNHEIMESSPQISFLVAGVQKAGTTALHSYLQSHPGLFLPDTKELHFFNNENIDWAKPNYES